MAPRRKLNWFTQWIGFSFQIQVISLLLCFLGFSSFLYSGFSLSRFLLFFFLLLFCLAYVPFSVYLFIFVSSVYIVSFFVCISVSSFLFQYRLSRSFSLFHSSVLSFLLSLSSERSLYPLSICTYVTIIFFNKRPQNLTFSKSSSKMNSIHLF